MFEDQELFLGAAALPETLTFQEASIQEASWKKAQGEVVLKFKGNFAITLSALIRQRVTKAPDGSLEVLRPNEGLRTMLSQCKTLGDAIKALNKGLKGKTLRTKTLTRVFIKKDGTCYAGSVTELAW